MLDGLIRLAHTANFYHKYAALWNVVDVSLLNLQLYGDCVNAPLLADCPVNIECRVVNSVLTGSHEMFIGVVEKVHADKEFVDGNGNIMYGNIKILQ